MNSLELGADSIEYILEVVDSAMAPPKHPRVLLFDIGGVCVSDMLLDDHCKPP
jgi:hypothetical protein